VRPITQQLPKKQRVEAHFGSVSEPGKRLFGGSVSMRSNVIRAAAIAALLALAGCGGGATTPASTSAVAGTHPDAPPPARTSASPRGALIGVHDLSATWTARPRTPTGLTCGGWDPLRGATRQLGSPRFNRESVDIQQTVGVFADTAAAARAYRRLGAAPTRRCTERMVHHRLGFASGAGSAFVGPATVVRTESLGTHSSGIRYAASVNGELGRGTGYIVTINSRIGTSVASLTVVSGIAHLAEAAYDQLVAAAERHLEAAYG
jgi:hypothetical protein